MKRIVLSLLVLVVCCSFAANADAFIFRRWRRSSSTSSSSWPSNINSSDQARAQHKANLMASQRRMSHGVAPLVGSFEGIGCGTSRNCSTCTPRGGMSLTADAAAQSSNGMWYRCRAWR